MHRCCKGLPYAFGGPNLSWDIRSCYCTITHSHQQSMVHEIRSGAAIQHLVCWPWTWSDHRRCPIIRLSTGQASQLFGVESCSSFLGWLRSASGSSLFSCCQIHLWRPVSWPKLRRWCCFSMLLSTKRVSRTRNSSRDRSWMLFGIPRCGFWPSWPFW